MYLEIGHVSIGEEYRKISPILANLVMEWFEQQALESYRGVPQDFGYAMLTT
jgi:hypothetical protein